MGEEYNFLDINDLRLGEEYWLLNVINLIKKDAKVPSRGFHGEAPSIHERFRMGELNPIDSSIVQVVYKNRDQSDTLNLEPNREGFLAARARSNKHVVFESVGSPIFLYCPLVSHSYVNYEKVPVLAFTGDPYRNKYANKYLEEEISIKSRELFKPENKNLEEIFEFILQNNKISYKYSNSNIYILMKTKEDIIDFWNTLMDYELFRRELRNKVAPSGEFARDAFVSSVGTQFRELEDFENNELNNVEGDEQNGNIQDVEG